MKASEKAIAYLLGNTFRVTTRLIRARFSEEDIPVSPDQFGVLNLISQQEDSLQSNIADIMEKDRSAVLRHLDVLESNNLIQRVVDSVDRRKKNLTITSRGYEVLRKGKKIIDLIMEELTTEVSKQDLQVFEKVLRQIQQKADR